MSEQRTHRVVFVATAGIEVRLFASIILKETVEVLTISTGSLCCDESAEQPEEALKELGIPYISLTAVRGGIVSLLKDLEPDVVVAGSDQEYVRRAFLYAADGLGIPTLLLQTGISSDALNTPSIATRRTIYRLQHHGWNILRKYAVLLRTVIAVRWQPLRIAKEIVRDIRIAFTVEDANSRFGSRTVAVSFQWQKQAMVSRGVDPDNIVIVGNPLIEPMDGAAEKNHAFSNGTDKRILFLTTAQVEHGKWTTEQRSWFVSGVIDRLVPLLSESVHLIVNIHPVESLAEYEQIVDMCSERPPITLTKDPLSATLVAGSDIILVGGYSTSILEMSTLCKPVLLLNLFNEVEGIPYSDMGLAIYIQSLDKLEVFVAELLRNPSARKRLSDSTREFCEKNPELVDGKAAERLSNLILELAETHRR